ncbi:Pentatricopeptide repeat-containing protein [Apostasia shenzhenica]|uniref:Pentatricopeptide repeat-containing protein n=1 Tax=Apostasia shenzhenica TaxID=1088818 RepID=A0A2I0AGY7_9ASPA|nr:Pentatricopeptide repeat-containing protein [Apostasia shenzhenica]
MVESSIEMDAVTPIGVLVACAKTGNLDMGRRIHSLIVRRGFDANVYLGASLISMYAKGGALDYAWKLFDKMPDRNAVCWTAMISGYAHSNRFREAMDLFREMQASHVKSDDAAIASVLSSCARLGALDQGKYIHAYCDVNGMGLSLLVKNALIDMYSKCGDISRALVIFHELVNPDVFSWTAMISGLAMHGNSLGAIELFLEMEASCKIVPNEITFLAVLSACSHGGLVEEGKYYFDRMQTVYELLPRIEHYGCMVDLLGRANLLLEAEKFIEGMPIKPDVIIWRSLLFGCRANENIEMAESAAKRILELEPKKCGGHVMLSNAYAAASRWTDVHWVRRRMNDWSIQKQPGCSFIEVNGVVHEFLSADKMCYQAEIIHDLLSGINWNSADS